MPLPTEVLNQAHVRAPKGIVYGPPGVGKTTFGANTHKPLIVDCENGDDAIDALDQGPWDLLLTDIVMPGADGIEVARVAAARQPGIRIMFITGFAAVALSAAQATPQAKVLSKPVHLRDLVNEVERMIAA